MTRSTEDSGIAPGPVVSAGIDGCANRGWDGSGRGGGDLAAFAMRFRLNWFGERILRELAIKIFSQLIQARYVIEELPEGDLEAEFFPATPASPV